MLPSLPDRVLNVYIMGLEGRGVQIFQVGLVLGLRQSSLRFQAEVFVRPFGSAYLSHQ